MNGDRFHFGRSDVGESVMRHAHSLKIELLKTPGELIIEFSLNGTISTEDLGPKATQFLRDLLREFEQSAEDDGAIC